MGYVRDLFWLALDWGLIPDFIIRWKVRGALRAQLAALDAGGVEAMTAKHEDFVAEISKMDIAVRQSDANEQHYEVPPELYQYVLGPRLKYSSCIWENHTVSLEEAELNMLELYVKRAQVDDGMTVLDLGCGWGSLCLFLAEKLPNCRVMAMSNSHSQIAFIRRKAAEKGLENLQALVGDVATYRNEEFSAKFDRILSVEMFEHMKNYGKLLEKLSSWLKTDGKLFVHMFTHARHSYHFERGWMARTFFSGGTMPSATLLERFQSRQLQLETRWAVSGEHYQKTLEAWLKQHDQVYKTIRPILDATYGKENGLRWFTNWRMFYLICAETFGLNGGNEWFVSMYRFAKVE